MERRSLGQNAKHSFALTNPMPHPKLSSFLTNLNEALKIRAIAAGPIPRSQMGGLEGSTKL